MVYISTMYILNSKGLRQVVFQAQYIHNITNAQTAKHVVKAIICNIVHIKINSMKYVEIEEVLIENM